MILKEDEKDDPILLQLDSDIILNVGGNNVAQQNRSLMSRGAKSKIHPSNSNQTDISNPSSATGHTRGSSDQQHEIWRKNSRFLFKYLVALNILLNSIEGVLPCMLPSIAARFQLSPTEQGKFSVFELK